MTETQEHEECVAISWFRGSYTAEQAELSAELQGLDFKNIKEIYGQIYHKCEAQSR